jgi:hypothetical protein
MRKAVEYLRAHPVIAGAVAVGLVLIVWLVATTPRPQPARVEQPAPVPAATPAVSATPVAQPAPAPVATPSPQPSPRPVAAVDAGRPDPFAPLVAPAGGEGGITGVPAPPPAPLPPPLFPGQESGQPGAQPSPPPPPPKEASTAELVGLLGDGGGVAIVKIGGKIFIVSRGDVILNKIRVQVVDVNKRIVVLEEEGEKFELKWEG